MRSSAPFARIRIDDNHILGNTHFLSARGGLPVTLLIGTLANMFMLMLMFKLRSTLGVSLNSLCIPLWAMAMRPRPTEDTIGHLLSMPLSQLSDAPTVEYLLPLPVPSVFTVSCSVLQGATLAKIREFISLRTVFKSFGRDSRGEKDTVLHVWGPL